MKKIILTSLFAPAAFCYEIGSLNVESGYKTDVPEEFVTSPVDIITGEEIKEKKPFFFTEIIQNKAGFSFSSNGGFGQTVSLYLWGNDPKRTLTLIDGIRVNDFTTPNISADFQHFLLEDVQQIEIIKGIQSGIWGADAVGGVINIVTKIPEKGFHVKIDGLVGDFNTKKYGTTISFANRKGYILLGFHKFDTSGFSAAEPKKGNHDYGKRWDEIGWERDPYKNETVNFKTGWNITENDKFEAVFKSIDEVDHYDAGAGVDAKDYDDPFGFGTAEYFNHGSYKFYKLGYTKKIRKNKVQIYWTKSVFNRSQYGGYSGEYREYTVKDRYNYSSGFINFGFTRADFKHDKSGGTGLNGFYHQNGYYAINVFRAKNLILSQSIRHDSYSTFKDKTTWKLGGKYLLSKEFYINGNWGTGYNVPTVDQLYNPWWGNKGLKPENSIEWDIGVGYKGFSISFFKYSIRDMIDYDFSTYKYKNLVGKTKIKGIDATYSRFFEPLKTFLKVGYTYLDTRKSDGSKLPRRPQNQIGFEVVWYPDENINIGFTGFYVGKRKDTDGSKTGYYTVLNAYLNMNIYKNLTAYLKFNNITDTYYQTVNGYATEGRSLYAGLNLKY